MKVQKIIFYFILFHAHVFYSQTFLLSGTVKANNEPLPFATIIVKGSSNGCTSNSEGIYSLKLPLGTYEIEIHYLGYSTKKEKVFLNKNIVLNVNMTIEGVSLNEIEIKAGEDPSYPIIREAIRKREYYYNQIDNYSCKTYIKGLQKIVELPKNFGKVLKFFGGKASDTNQLKGIIYLSESESNFYFKKPNQINEVMFSSKVSGNSQSFSFNKLSDMNINFNKNLVDMKGLSDRPLISPIHSNALFYYKYFLQGIDSSDNRKIYKIKIVPKRNTDPCFKGVIYIQDSSWRITGVDLRLSKANKLNFVDTLYIKQVQASVMGDSIWMPINLNLSFDFKILGVSGYGYFNAHLKEFLFNLNKTPNQNANEVLKISSEATEKDSSYWNENRPTPLTNEEKTDYRIKDSIKILVASKRFQDSLDKLDNHFEIGNLITGYTYNKSSKKLKLTFPGLLNNGIQYNTVEGMNLSYQFTLDKTFKNFDKTEITSKIRYGFANELLGGELGWHYNLEPLKFTRFGFKIKSIVEQYNQQSPISPLVNSLYTLFLNENFMKVFKETGLEANYFSELVNGIFFTSNLKYVQREALINHTNLLLIDDPNKEFTINNPAQSFGQDSTFNSHSAFTTEFTFSFRFRQKYYSVPHQKIVIGSKYPKLNITYKRAFPVFNCTANYDLLSATILDDIKLGLFGKFAYRIKGGGFLDTKKIYFLDYKYFLGNQTVINTNDYLSSFRMLPYYTYSAEKWYIEAHAEHHFRGFIINKIPLLKKLSIQEIVGMHVLKSNRINKYYYEINFGVERIFKLIRFDYVLSYLDNSNFKQGITFGFTFSL